jgi:hypothetical protein
MNEEVITDPSVMAKKLSDNQLLAKHDGLHKAWDTTHNKTDTVAAHHYLAEEMRDRGLGHDIVDCDLHKSVVEMSVVRVTVASLAKRLSSKEVEAVVNMAVKNGTAYANVHEMLTSNGWVLSASPSEPQEDDSEEEEMMFDLSDRQSATVEATESLVKQYGLYSHGMDENGAHYMGAEDNPFVEEGLKCSNCVAFCGGGGCEWVEGEISPEGLCKLWVIPVKNLGLSVSNKSVSLSPRSNKQADLEVTKEDPTSDEVHLDSVVWTGSKKKKKPVMASEDGDQQQTVVFKSADEHRFTLGPWYVPNAADAHDEWTDSAELQKALWEYVRKGDRSIRLQHAPDTKAGEWVEAMTMPFDIDVPMMSPDTNESVSKVFPEGTVFLGVVWEPWAWEMVKNGEITGYSIGGSAERYEIDLPQMENMQ